MVIRKECSNEAASQTMYTIGIQGSEEYCFTADQISIK